MQLIRSSLLVGFALVVVACSSSSETTTTTVGVNDVAKACAITSTWNNAGTERCTDCKSFASTAKCACSDLDYAGKCSEQQSAVVAEPTCSGVDACVTACGGKDCNCVERCYADKAACRSLSSARDGCVADVCDSRCR